MMSDERATPRQVNEQQITAPRPMGRFPTDGRQHAYKSYVSASLNPRQTPEPFGGVSTD